MKRKIYIDGRHWDNIMQLPCVRGLNKRGEGYVVKVKVGKASTVFAAAGDAIVEKDDGSWSVEKKESMAPRRLKSGNMLAPTFATGSRQVEVFHGTSASMKRNASPVHVSGLPKRAASNTRKEASNE